MGMRRIGSTVRKTQRAKVHSRNHKRKTRERASRARGMVAAIQGRPLPYEPWVMSWLTSNRGKPPGAITQADVDQVVSRHSARA